MVKVNKIDVVGFKSFADRVSIHFGQGMTGIVGPNGCGKSNIFDAFLWVTGEQRVKNVRGDKMLDVIFMGSEHRKPVNFAEVSLHLSNENKEIPIEYEVLVLTRKLYRSGESEYRINGQIVRLKDIQSLLWDTGLAFSTMSQGKIDGLVMQKPLERRKAFEEAAGIARYRERKKETQHKLKGLEHNRHRLRDIYSEVENQVKLLEKQAQLAKAYQSNKQTLECVDKSLTYKKFKESQALYDKLKSQKINLQAEIIKHQEDLQARENCLAILMKEIKEKDSLFSQSQTDFFDLKNSRDIAQVKYKSSQERLEEILVKKHELFEELEKLEKFITMTPEDYQKSKVNKESLFKEITDLENNKTRYNQDLLGIEQEVGSLRPRVSKYQEAYLKVEKQENKYITEIQEKKSYLSSAEEKLELVSKRTLCVDNRIKELEFTKDKETTKIQILSQTIDEKRKDLSRLSTNYQSLEQTFKTEEKKYQNLLEEIMKYEARVQALEQLMEDKNSLDSSTASLLEEATRKGSKFYKKVLLLKDQVRAKEGFELLQATFLQIYPHGIVLETIEDLENVMKWTVKHQIKDLCFICLEKLAVDSLSTQPRIGKPLSCYVITSNDKLRVFLDLILVTDIQKGNFQLEDKTKAILSPCGKE